MSNKAVERGCVVWVQSGQKLDHAVRVETTHVGKDAMVSALVQLDPFNPYNTNIGGTHSHFIRQYIGYWEGVAEDIAIGSHPSCVKVCA